MNEPKPNCKYCHGTGVVTDWVPYGSTNVPMESDCDCMYEDDVICPICDGMGYVKVTLAENKGKPFTVCLTCHGEGYVSQEKYDTMTDKDDTSVYDEFADLWKDN